MSQYRVELKPLDQIEAEWAEGRFDLSWPHPFVLPGWLKIWWRFFGSDKIPTVWTVSDQRRLLGIAPLMTSDQHAGFIGDPDVCDYQDFIVNPGSEALFFEQLFGRLKAVGIRCLELSALRADATILRIDPRWLKCRRECRRLGLTYEMPLPASWDAFLNGLTGKHRHEIRRKLRRLYEAGRIHLKRIDNRGDVGEAVDVFIELFRANRRDKRLFMSPKKAGFFRALAKQMAAWDILNLYLLEIDGHPAAAVIGFVYDRTLYLYNNGYDRRYQSLSVGFLSKVLTIKDGIQRRLEHYSFLKGAEPYKHRLGGRPHPIYQCRLSIGESVFKSDHRL